MKKSKNILIDLDRLKNPYNGLGQFSLNFGKNLASLQPEELQFTFLVPPNYVGYFGHNVNYEVANWKRRFFSRFLKRYDLWHAIHQDSNFFPNPQTKFLLTIHDLNFLKEKSPQKAKKRLQKLQKKINLSCGVTTISEFSKNEILNNLQINVPVYVIYNGIELSELSRKSDVLTSDNSKLLLGIGVIQPKKNWHILVNFMKFLPENYILQIAGDDNSSYAKELKKQIQQSGLTQRIKLLGKVSEEQKASLLHNCYAFVFPSKLEGMGMPPLEAMQAGKPVFVFPYSSIPEFCKDYAFYWENENPLSMAKFFLDKTNYFYSNTQLSLRIQEYAKQWNWKKTTLQYIELYQSLLGITEKLN